MNWAITWSRTCYSEPFAILIIVNSKILFLCMWFRNRISKPGIMTHTCNFKTSKAGTGKLQLSLRTAWVHRRSIYSLSYTADLSQRYTNKEKNELFKALYFTHIHISVYYVWFIFRYLYVYIIGWPKHANKHILLSMLYVLWQTYKI